MMPCKPKRNLTLPPLLAVLAAAAALILLPASAALAEGKGKCPNEALRTGRSAGLPDCRAYELVTPPELGRTQDIVLAKGNTAAAAADGEAVALHANGSYLEPGASYSGTRAVFARTASGWTMKSIVPSAMAQESTATIDLLSPDFSQVGVLFQNPQHPQLSGGSESAAFGPVGGPYTTLNVDAEANPNAEAHLSGANSGTLGASGVPAFSDVVFSSPDHSLLAHGVEREHAEETPTGLLDLYEWSGGRLRLVNLDSGGGLLNRCGALLGYEHENGDTVNAVSDDGSRVFFTSPEVSEMPGCTEPALYMRVGGRETVDVSEPNEGVNVPSAGRGTVQFAGASADGSKVFFITQTKLTAGAGPGLHLYEYDVEAPVGHRLTLISNETGKIIKADVEVLVSDDGSNVYYRASGGLYRYETATGRTSFVAMTHETKGAQEPMYTTPDGGFLLFPSGAPTESGPLIAGPHGYPEVIEESRGAHHGELYRYDAASGGVVCVSCGEGAVAPAEGETIQPEPITSLLSPEDALRAPVAISNDGGRVFFQTSQRLVPQDTNSTAFFGLTLGEGADTYEWEAPGVEVGPGVSCGVVVGCTSLISTGEDVGPENFIGASEDGNNVFFVSAAPLLPQATPEFDNIYDARVGGGFPASAKAPECSSCQGAGSPPPLFGAAASETFNGPGNPAPTAAPAASPSTPSSSQVKKAVKCAKGRKLSGGRCVKVKAPKAKRKKGRL